ncbi:AAA family ATPase [Streptomyces sp. NPDC059456]|uniref:AAA family ATPase n=1 Tax=Streptomyces sp. NPDC059456 TaxID=3346838 RepID=UPI003690067C
MLIGRRNERAAIATALSQEAEAASLLLLGEAGVGKTALLESAVDRAVQDGTRVLRVRGNAAETELAFAGLHQLLLPILDRVDGLPVRQGAALLSAFGLGDDPTPPDHMMMSLAVLTLTSQVASTRRLLLAVDDAQWIDHGSCQVLGFLARRLEGEPIALLVAARGTHRPDWLDRSVPELVVPALSPAEAEELLGAQPDPPTGSARRQVLATAAGNPLALEELARAAARDGALRTAGQVPVTDLLERTFATQVDALPTATREALLVAAAAEGAGLAAVSAALAPGTDVDVWLPAEQAGLIRLHADRLDFRHPLIRSAIYSAAPFSVRRHAHLALAAALEGDPDRRAWQLSAATVAPDAAVSGALETTAMRAFARGAMAEAVAGLERAVQLNPSPAEQARLLATAAYGAILVGDVDRAEALGARAAELNTDPVAAPYINALTGLVALLMMRLDCAFTLVVPDTLRGGAASDPATTTKAAGVGYPTGKPAPRARLAAGHAPPPGGPPPGGGGPRTPPPPPPRSRRGSSTTRATARSGSGSPRSWPRASRTAGRRTRSSCGTPV